MKNRLPDPAEICALGSKGKFRRFGNGTVSATIDQPNPDISGDHRIASVAAKIPSTQRQRPSNSNAVQFQNPMPVATR
jgi:hypothetical protein